MALSKEQLLRLEIENAIMEVVDLNEEVSRSDLQGIASVVANRIIEMVRQHSSASEGSSKK